MRLVLTLLQVFWAISVNKRNSLFTPGCDITRRICQATKRWATRKDHTPHSHTALLLFSHLLYARVTGSFPRRFIRGPNFPSHFRASEAGEALFCFNRAPPLVEHLKPEGPNLLTMSYNLRLGSGVFPGPALKAKDKFDGWGCLL
jgi:hypothetical protein